MKKSYNNVFGYYYKLLKIMNDNDYNEFIQITQVNRINFIYDIHLSSNF